VGVLSTGSLSIGLISIGLLSIGSLSVGSVSNGLLSEEGISNGSLSVDSTSAIGSFTWQDTSITKSIRSITIIFLFTMYYLQYKLLILLIIAHFFLKFNSKIKVVFNYLDPIKAVGR
jgi:hypothetical protein